MATVWINNSPHVFVAVRRLPWPVCSRCGLVRLRNALTDWCVKAGCDHEEHPGYRQAVRALGRPEGAMV